MGKHCNGVFCPGVGAVEAALAAEEITTELLAAEVVNTTAAGFTTGGLAEAQDLPCGSYNSDDCESEFHHGLGPFCSRCSNEGATTLCATDATCAAQSAEQSRVRRVFDRAGEAAGCGVIDG